VHGQPLQVPESAAKVEVDLEASAVNCHVQHKTIAHTMPLLLDLHVQSAVSDLSFGSCSLSISLTLLIFLMDWLMLLACIPVPD